jgi:hypothetical protein
MVLDTGDLPLIGCVNFGAVLLYGEFSAWIGVGDPGHPEEAQIVAVNVSGLSQSLDACLCEGIKVSLWEPVPFTPVRPTLFLAAGIQAQAVPEGGFVFESIPYPGLCRLRWRMSPEEAGRMAFAMMAVACRELLGWGIIAERHGVPMRDLLEVTRLIKSLPLAPRLRVEMGADDGQA